MWKTIRSRYAGMAELADARDLKSREINFSYRFDPGFRHHYIAEWSSLVARRAHNPKVMRFKSHLRNQRNSVHRSVFRVFSFALRKRCEMEFEPHELRSMTTLRVLPCFGCQHCLRQRRKLARRSDSGAGSIPPIRMAELTKFCIKLCVFLEPNYTYKRKIICYNNSTNRFDNFLFLMYNLRRYNE